MRSRFSVLLSLKEFFDGRLQEFTSDINNVHSVWLYEIKEIADLVLTRDLSAVPELTPNRPTRSQKKSHRRKRRRGSQEGTSSNRRFSKGKRSKFPGSSVKPSDIIAEDEGIPQASTSEQVIEQPKRRTRRKTKTNPEVSLEAAADSDCSAEQVPEEEPEVVDMELETAVPNADTKIDTDEPQACFSNTTPSPPKIHNLKVSVRISSTGRRSAELVTELEASPGFNATKIVIARTPTRAERSSARHSLKLRYSKAGLRGSMTPNAVRRVSRRSILKKKSTRGGDTTRSSDASVEDDSRMETDGEVGKNTELPSGESDEVEITVEEVKATAETAEQQQMDCHELVTHSRADNSPSVLLPVLTSQFRDVPSDISSGSAKKAFGGSRRTRSVKRKSPDIQEDSPTKKLSPPRKCKSATRPNRRAFLQTVQKNQRLVMTPGSVGCSTLMKFFITHHTTPLKIAAKSKELLEALKKKQEQEEERMKKMEEEMRQTLEEQKRKRDERLSKVVEARTKEDEEKKKRIKQKMSQTDGENGKMRIEQMAEEKAKKKVAVKRQEEVDQKRRMEEEDRLKKIQQAEEEKRQQELVAKQAAEDEECARKLAEARRALELRRERKLEKERERQAVAERERAEREKALALQHELERAARKKERRELEEKRQLEEGRRREEQKRLAAENAAREREAAKQKMAAGSVALNNVQSSVLQTPVRKGAALNITMEVEKSPQSYSITPKGGNKPLIKSTSAEDYGMDQKSDDSTDDESAPRKPIPSWAQGHDLHQAITKQYFSPLDLHSYFGTCEPPRLENIFYKNKPRYFKRTSSAMWHCPP